jgi:hypothetical protein
VRIVVGIFRLIECHDLDQQQHVARTVQGYKAIHEVGFAKIKHTDLK